MTAKKRSRQAYCEMITKLIRKHLEFARDGLRDLQIKGLEKLANFVLSGKLLGLVKQPTGAGKTRFFGEVLSAISRRSLVLVPRVNLITDTKIALVGNAEQDIDGLGFLDSEVIAMEIKPGASAPDVFRIIVNDLNGNIERRSVLIMTYQSFLSISKKESQMLDNFMSTVMVIISDEAHRSLGKKTKRLISKYDSVNDDDDEISADYELDDLDLETQQEIEEAEKLIDKKYPILHLRMTATPRLSLKDVHSEYDIDIIDWVRVEEAVTERVLILPQLPYIGKATYKLEDDQVINDALLNNLAEQERFRMENGQTVAECLTDKYLELREKHFRYLPAVAFCGTIAHAESYCQYLKSRGVRAIRSTSANQDYDAGVSPSDAKKLFHNETIDVVVTVTKVGEGWDVPTLRCAIWLVPRRSPAQIMQGNGRIMRTLPENSLHQAKTRDNTYVLEPEWELLRVSSSLRNKDEDSGTKKTVKNDPESDDKSKQSKVRLFNFYENLVHLDEFHIDTVRGLAGSGWIIREQFDYRNNDHLRQLIGSIEKLVIEGKGISLMTAYFSLPEKAWTISGHQIGYALFNTGSPNSQHAEELARMLWPEEAEKLLPKEKFDFHNNDHLRQLIGFIEKLVIKSKGISLMTAYFSLPEKAWTISGCQIGYALFNTGSPNSQHAEELARMLWPEEAEKLLPKEKFDFHNNDHLRQLIGSIEKLVIEGKGIYLRKANFSLPEKVWTISGRQIGHALFNTYAPNSQHAEELARMLWPEEAEKLIQKRK